MFNLNGQLFTRDTKAILSDPSKKLMWFCGLVAVDQISSFKSEHQYDFRGNDYENIISLHISTHTGKDLTDLVRGSTANQILQAPIWKA